MSNICVDLKRFFFKKNLLHFPDLFQPQVSLWIMPFSLMSLCATYKSSDSFVRFCVWSVRFHLNHSKTFKMFDQKSSLNNTFSLHCLLILWIKTFFIVHNPCRKVQPDIGNMIFSVCLRILLVLFTHSAGVMLTVTWQWSLRCWHIFWQTGSLSSHRLN